MGSVYEELEHAFSQIPMHNVMILLDFNAKVGRENIFKCTIGKVSLHETGSEK
jgi:hypothetical protein